MKLIQLNFILFSAILILTIACKQAGLSLSKSEMRNIVEQQNKLLEKCFTEGNIDGLALIYADSAKLC